MVGRDRVTVGKGKESMGDRSEGGRKRLGVSYLPFTIDDLGGAGDNSVGGEERGCDRTKEGDR